MVTRFLALSWPDLVPTMQRFDFSCNIPAPYIPPPQMPAQVEATMASQRIGRKSLSHIKVVIYLRGLYSKIKFWTLGYSGTGPCDLV